MKASSTRRSRYYLPNRFFGDRVDRFVDTVGHVEESDSRLVSYEEMVPLCWGFELENGIVRRGGGAGACTHQLGKAGESDADPGATLFSALSKEKRPRR